MKSRLSGAVLGVLGVLAGGALMVGAAQAEMRLTILHTNDFHARFEPVNGFDSTCAAADNDAGACFGGSARLMSAVREARARAANSNVILVDGGDQFQGTLFYTRYKGQLAAEMMNRMGYDAMTVGNHEFDDGPEVLRAFVQAVNFPVLMSNADLSDEPALDGRIARSSVIVRGGERIGLIGLTPQDTGELSSPGPNVRFSDPVEAVRAEVARLSGDGVNKIIVLSHSGYGVDRHVAAEVQGIDVIVGGHSNTYLHSDDPRAEGPYPTMVGNTAVVQAYAYGRFLGVLEVVFDEAGQIVSASGAPWEMDKAVPEDEAIKARVEEAGEPLEELRNRVVAETSGPIAGDKAACRSGQCAMGTLITDAMLDRVRSQGIDVALQNGGGLRAGIDAGEITMGEVLTVLPFQNTLSTFRVRGEVLKRALENGVSQVGEEAGRFPQVAGMSFVYDPAAPVGERVREVLVNEAPLEAERLYGMVSNNYIRNGGDGYEMFLEAEDAYDFGPDVAEVVAEFLAGKGAYVPYVGARSRVLGE